MRIPLAGQATAGYSSAPTHSAVVFRLFDFASSAVGTIFECQQIRTPFELGLAGPACSGPLRVAERRRGPAHSRRVRGGGGEQRPHLDHPSPYHPI